MPQIKISTIVLADGAAKPDFVSATGVANRALVELATGKTMLDFILHALNGAATVGYVFVVGNVPAQTGAVILKPGSSLVENIIIGIDASGVHPDDKVLLVSSDIPFIKSDEVDALVDQCSKLDADFCYPIIPMDIYRTQFGQMKRTTLKLKEGEFTGGNIMMVRAGVITKNPDAIRSAYAARKSVAKLGGMLGWGLLGKIVFSQLCAPKLLTISVLESAVSKLLGEVNAKAVITPLPSIGTDIDDAKDVAIAREVLALQAVVRS